MGKVVGVIAIKGGVGKTTTVTNLASVLASEFGQKVLVVDGNFSAANLGLHLGLVNPEVTLHDVLAGKHEMEDAIQKHDLGFDVLPASVVPKKVEMLELKSHIKKIKDKYDMVLIDSSPALNEEILATMMASDELLVVTSPDHPTLSCTMHAVKVAKRRGTPITGLILNRVYNKQFELTTQEVEEATETPVLAVIPHDVRVLEALAATTPASVHGDISDVGVEYRKLAGALLGKQYEDRRLTSRVKGWLQRGKLMEVPKHEVNRTLLSDSVGKE
ncbi:TPA: AAA family ATPase [Candidatus Woesearchaeota archaeon]|nr:AAA family ATPase [Candidatus Woesearchaeota archaeon]HIH47417.1 AAA family ATPase [Candidatus Woesearchaeota archaeon]HII88033.1 AAA family ATPase [Candidatus Woesearchaeota archaeon]